MSQGSKEISERIEKAMAELWYIQGRRQDYNYKPDNIRIYRVAEKYNLKTFVLKRLF